MVNLTAKKIFCPKCRTLNRVKLAVNGDEKKFTCVKCDFVIWKKEGMKWKHFKAD